MSSAQRDTATRSIVVSTVAGSVLSVVLSIVLLAAIDLAAQVAFLIALSGVILSALLGAAVELGKRLDSLGETVLEGTRLNALVGMPQAEAEVVQMATCLEQIAGEKEGQQGFFWEAGLRAVEDARKAVAKVASGVVDCTAEQETFFVNQALEYTHRSVDAVAARGIAWWRTPAAEFYWNVYGRAAQRLRIRRVFLVPTPFTDEIRAVLDRHAELGMETYWTPTDLLPDAYRRPIVIFDDRLLHRTTSSPQSGADHADFTRSAREISQAREQFAALLALHATQRWEAGSRGPTVTVVEQSS